MKELGIHLLLELDGCDREKLDDMEYIENLMIHSAQKAGATVLGHQFHKFEPQGLSGVVVLAESHISIHTWPEHRFAAVDCFTCGEHVDPYVAAIELSIGLNSKENRTTKILRGSNW